MNYYERLTRKPKIYLTPDQLLEDAAKYFKWAEEHPLREEKVFCHKGDIVRADESKMRAFTRKGLATYLGITTEKLKTLGKRDDDWAEALEKIDQVIYTQKFEGAAAGLLNATMITRDLGLAEKTEVGGLSSAPPVAFTINPISSGTFLPPDEATQTPV